jgi:hypothetical protein
MDVKNAFLNGFLEETIYLCAPAGLLIPKGIFLLLVKSFYGMEKAPRALIIFLVDWLLAVKS